MKNIVVTGSVAYDHIMVFPDRFEKHLLPDKEHQLSVCFNVESLEKSFGGTAANIAYTMSLIGMNPLMLATVGKDDAEYRARFEDLRLSQQGILTLEDEMTAQAFITTDLKDNQITAFHGGAMYRAHEQSLAVFDQKPDLVLISPDGLDAMTQAAEYCRTQQIPFWFDPGQALSALSKEQLLFALEGSRGILVNDYEWELLQKKTDHNLGMILEKVPVVIETLGKEGANILTREGLEHVHALRNVRCVDPTGAGDAFRAGFLYGLSLGSGLMESVEYAHTAASFAVEVQGTQSHHFTKEDFFQRKEALAA